MPLENNQRLSIDPYLKRLYAGCGNNCFSSIDTVAFSSWTAGRYDKAAVCYRSTCIGGAKSKAMCRNRLVISLCECEGSNGK